MRVTKLSMVLVGIVVVVLAVGYFAVIGWSEPVKDFSPSGGFESTTSQGNSSLNHQYVAYATFTNYYKIAPYSGGFTTDSSGSAQATGHLAVMNIEIQPSVQPYTSTSAGQVYEHHLLQLSAGTGGEGGQISAFIQYYVTVRLTGTGGYDTSWQLSSRTYSTLGTEIESLSFETGRAWFPTDGDFQATVTFYQYINGVPVQLITALSSFYVSY